MSDEGGEVEDPEIISIGDLRIRRLERRRREGDACQHKHLLMEPEGEILSCKDCNRQVSAFWALGRLLDQYRDARRAVRSEWERAHWERRKTVHLVAAKRVEEAWKRKMAPCCPHCGQAILPEDGLGDSQVNRAIEVIRRAQKGNS